MNKTLKSGILALLAAVPAAYGQDVTYSWTLSGPVTGSGTITVNPVYVENDNGVGIFSGSGSEYDYVVTGMTGTLSGAGTITGMVYPGDVGGEPLGWFATTLPSSSSSFTPDIGVNVYTSGGGGNYSIDAGPSIIVGDNLNEGQIADNNPPFTVVLAEFMTLGPAGVAPVPESPLNPGLVAAAGLLIGWRSWRSLRATRA